MTAAPNFAVVGCRECSWYWIIDGGHRETRNCPRCNTTHSHTLKRIEETDERDIAEASRAVALAKTSRRDDVETDPEWYLDIREDVHTTIAKTHTESGEVFIPSVEIDDEFDVDLEALVDAAPSPADELDEDWTTAFETYDTAFEDEVSPGLEDVVDAPTPDDPTSRSQTPGVRTGITPATPGESGSLAERYFVLSGEDAITPRAYRDRWLCEALIDLLKPLAATVRDHVRDVDPAALEAGRRPTDAGRLIEDLMQAGVVAQDGQWASALVDYATRYCNDAGHPTLPVPSESEATADGGTDDYRDRREYHRDHRQSLLDQLIAPATTGGQFQAGAEAVRQSVVAAVDYLLDDDTDILYRMHMDADAWLDADQDTAERALEALALLASVTEVRLVIGSRTLAAALVDDHREWLEAHIDLTDLEEAYPRVQTPEAQSGPSEDARERAHGYLDALSDDSGKARIVSSLRDGERTVKGLKADPEIQAADASIDVYLSDLEANGIVDVESAHPSNSVRLTDAGEVVADHVDPTSYAVRCPGQSALVASLTLTPQSQTSTVCGTRQGREGGTSLEPAPLVPRTSPDRWVAATGDADRDADYVQWLGAPDGQMDRYTMHKRLSAAKRTDGVTCVDDRINEFEDGRVSYVSAFDDELLVVAQWGRSLPTLGRIVGALLSNRALSKILAPSQVGHDFSDLFGGKEVWSEFVDDIEDLIRWGTQVGWFGDDETNWDSWYDRITGVRAMCMERVGELAGSKDWEERGDLFEDLLGLLTSATALYDAAGLDVTINVRVPDVQNLVTDEWLHSDFIDFWRYTVPKQAVYRSPTGAHSFYRSVLEDRPEKLKKRLSIEFDEQAPESDLTASWVLTGPSATELIDPISNAIAREVEEMREQVADGVEPAPVLNVPVVSGNSYRAIKDVVQEFASGKGYQTVDEAAAAGYAKDVDDLRRLTRLFIRFLATEDRPNQASPYDVAEALLRLASSSRSGDFLSADDVAFGLSQLPPERLLPDVPRSPTAIYQAILATGDTAGRSTICESPNVSESTYDRHHEDFYSTFSALGLVEEVSEQGRRRFRATIEPWWDDEMRSVELPAEAAGSSLSASSPTRERDALFELAVGMGLDIDYSLFGPAADVEEIYAAADELRNWRGLLNDLCGEPPTREDSPPPRPVVIGRYPDSRDASLEAFESDDASLTANPSRAKSTDGGLNGWR
jgi:hypothetical protein